MTDYRTVFASPFGALLISSNDEHLTGITHHTAPGPHSSDSHPIIDDTIRQLREYFVGERSHFDLPLELGVGTAFQQRVWKALLDIPLGKIRSYGAIAEAIGARNAQRAVGQANNKNPFSIIVPCHRVVGSSGKLTGYAGGLDRKLWLLEFEATITERARGEDKGAPLPIPAMSEP